MSTNIPERIEVAAGLTIPRVVTGLWQVADMERGGRTLDSDRATAEMAAYAEAGFTAFDMADHYGSAEDIAGRLNRLVSEGRAKLPDGTHPALFTKWCPTPGPMTPAVVRAAVDRARDRLQTKTIDLLQFHWWTFQHPAWLDAMHALAGLQRDGLIR